MKWKLHSKTDGNLSSPNINVGSKNLFRKTLLAVTVAASGSLLITAPAFASAFVCTRYQNDTGHNLCIATANLNNGTSVTGNSATNRRGINFLDQHFTNQGREVFRLAFAGSPNNSLCVGLSAAGNATIRDCSGNSNFTNWQAFINTSDNSVTWINNSFSNPPTCGVSGCVLTSDGNGGDQLFATNSAVSGGFQKWTAN